ncbi:hypothetical protein GUITHDRAFT_119052 [Guillardia theta CCMP2712]|uniref:Uncharacterized protein n=1 Tax=Guillardia theta (strain CCMP2712) TaxID=905079 RepID=L1IF91_GUITC|nr:hypothetical protein GUITHDRAFT_119052 [Guillardia theta CCMP2712]EKX34742.1 hypothetical protein GUITHDRAFT_119052 [Guillardia theta CCMP2712]|eukprot:XP_005821722.1 hypothetical protein GUITHDRAFT_119052 [Guillardia theta CCMP2712]
MESETVSEQDLELEKAFCGQQSFAVIKQHLHPSKGKRAHVYISDTACRILGLHAEEALARIASSPLNLYTRIRDLGSNGDTGCVVTRFAQQEEFDSVRAHRNRARVRQRLIGKKGQLAVSYSCLILASPGYTWILYPSVNLLKRTPLEVSVAGTVNVPVVLSS